LVNVTVGLGFKVIEKFGETAPFPQRLVPLTVRMPEVAPDEKSMVTAFVLPLIVAPLPLYDQIYDVALAIGLTE
jgi:hypothetical protein